jgi:T5SS/PEP-CTERM-associated repeat protein
MTGVTSTSKQELISSTALGRGLASALLSPLPVMLAFAPASAMAQDLVLDGAGATTTWSTDRTVTGELTVGEANRDVGLKIDSGADVIVTREITIGQRAGSSGTITVSGAGSRLEVQRTNSVLGNQIRIGANGFGVLNVEDGAEVAARELSMGGAANAGGILKVSGPGAMLTTDRLINSSWASAGDNSGAITIDRGGRVTTLNVTIGASPADNRATVAQTLISGANSLWANGQLFENGRSMTIQDGGRLTTGDAELGGNATTLATTYVTGAGSAFIATGTIRIGDLEQHNLAVANGANLSAREIILGGRSLGNGDSFGALTIGGRISINIFDEPSSVTAVAAGTVDPNTLISFTGTDGNLVFNHTDSGYRFTNKIAGDGAIYNLAGETILSGDLSGFVGTSTLGGVVVSGGRLVIESDFGTAANTSDGTRIYVNNGTVRRQHQWHRFEVVSTDLRL